MKKFIITGLSLILMLITFTTNIYAASINDTSIKKSIKNVNSYLSENTDYNIPDCLNKITDSDGNVPAYKYYPTQTSSRGIASLKEYDGKIFMGLGDWNDNTGPVKILYYDTKKDKILSSGTIADEAVENFNIIDNKLYTTGCDPRADWGYGSYYQYDKNDNKWKQYQKKNGWVHVFNMVKFEDKLFMCGESQTSATPIQSSSDNGETFKAISLYKNSKKVPSEDNLRCYNLYQYNKHLYAFVCKYIDSTHVSEYDGIYEYDSKNNQFTYIADIPATYCPGGSFGYRFSKSSIFKNKFVYVAGYYLYTTEDFKNFTKIPTQFGYNLQPINSNSNVFTINTPTEVVENSLVVDDTLYLLTFENTQDAKDEKSFITKIYSTKDLKNFNLVYKFETETIPFSFEYYNNSFYIGTSLGYTKKSSKDNRKFI